jgi:hypothetical protein
MRSTSRTVIMSLLLTSLLVGLRRTKFISKGQTAGRDLLSKAALWLALVYEDHGIK